jgi:flagellar basal-body rod protein FlgB
MTEMPSIFSLAASAARHAAARTSVIASNVANADTPGYQAVDLAPFSPEIGGQTMRRTRPGHLGVAPAIEGRAERIAMRDPNGNTVTLEDQILRGIDAQRSHNRAVTVYSTALDMLRASLGRR